ncbi:Glutathione hydrolase 7 [Lamellibrachia satsuma]|nr:Glutathione hydrolase 7 [Lamellibrachia satsuma]
MSDPLPNGAMAGATSYHDVCLDGPSPKAKVDKQQLIGGQTATSPDSIGSEVAPLQVEECQSRARGESSESLKVIVVSSVVFGIAILVALLVSIKYAPPQVGLASAVVVADDAACSTIGTDMLKKGGSGVDAAIAALLCQGVVHMHTSGIGGGGCMLIRDHKEQHTVAIDFREEVPSNASRNLSGNLGVLVAVPGQLRGLEMAHNKYGKLAWKDVVMPAVELAQKGFNESKASASIVTGDAHQLTNLAKTLERVANEGADVVYTGAIAEEIMNMVNSNGGTFMMEDLIKYSAHQSNPVASSFHGVTVETAPPPSAGPILLMILNVLDTFPLSPANTTDPATYHRLIEAIKFGMGNLHKVGYPSPKNITQQLISKSFAKDVHKKIGTSPHSWGYYTDEQDFAPAEIQGTHIFVKTHLGDYISVISSLGGMPGKRLVTSDGIILNNAIVNFKKASSSNNVYKPGARPAFMLTPVIVHAEKRPCGIKNAVGGSQNSAAISDVAQVVLNMVAYSMNLSAAIEAPRVQYNFNSSNITYDRPLSAKVLEYLRNKGHQLHLTTVNTTDHVDGVARINETVHGHADSRGNGNVTFAD